MGIELALSHEMKDTNKREAKMRQNPFKSESIMTMLDAIENLHAATNFGYRF